MHSTILSINFHGLLNIYSKSRIVGQLRHISRKLYHWIIALNRMKKYEFIVLPWNVPEIFDHQMRVSIIVKHKFNYIFTKDLFFNYFWSNFIDRFILLGIHWPVNLLGQVTFRSSFKIVRRLDVIEHMNAISRINILNYYKSVYLIICKLLQNNVLLPNPLWKLHQNKHDLYPDI